MIMQVVLETSTGLMFLLMKIFFIVVPLMMVLEISREYRFVDSLTRTVSRPARALGFERDSIYPLLAGVIFGLSYGGGVLIGESSAGRIIGKQRFYVALYLGLCHAVFEDTLIFVSLGANGIIVLSSRLILATVVVAAISFFRRGKIA